MEERKLTVSSSVLDALKHAGKDDAAYPIIVGNGDLVQMGAQYRFLRDLGFAVGRRDVYPAVTSEDEKKRALQAMWAARVDGWWNLGLVKAGICTQEEHRQALEGVP